MLRVAFFNVTRSLILANFSTPYNGSVIGLSSQINSQIIPIRIDITNCDKWIDQMWAGENWLKTSHFGGGLATIFVPGNR
jgi:hypothetical protein